MTVTSGHGIKARPTRVFRNAVTGGSASQIQAAIMRWRQAAFVADPLETGVDQVLSAPGGKPFA